MTTRQAWQRSITDDAGNLLTGVQISVFQRDGITPATIYSGLTDAAMANPFNTGVQTVARFYAEPGLYVIRAFKAGVGTQEWVNVDISGWAVREDIDIPAPDAAAPLLNVELACNGFKGLSNALYNSGGFYSLFPGAGITSAEFATPYGWTFPTAAVNKRWFASGPLTWDMSQKSVVLAFKIKAAAQSSAQTYGGSMSGSSAGFSIVVRASTDGTYPNAIEIRCRSGGGNYDSYYITQNLMDDTFHSVMVGFCAATKIMRVWVDGQYHGQAYMTRVMEYQSRGNLVGNERMVLGAAAASGTNSWIHSGRSLFYATYAGPIADLDMNKIAFNHHFNDTLGA